MLELVFHHGEQNRAFYRPATDTIHLPDKSQFPSADRYYATALHELGHATGAPSRLDRDLAHPFGSEGYAREELRVEIDEARRQIESIIGRRVTRAACPFGAYNAPCLRKLKSSGFERVYTSDGGVTTARDWLVARNTLRRSDRLSDVQALVERPPVGLRHLSRRLRTFAKSKRRRASW